MGRIRNRIERVGENELHRKVSRMLPMTDEEYCSAGAPPIAINKDIAFSEGKRVILTNSAIALLANIALFAGGHLLYKAEHPSAAPKEPLPAQCNSHGLVFPMPQPVVQIPSAEAPQTWQ
ncbi:MAG TPA: hypothetical protein VHB72_00720 [Candidatus Saccharimonadales bacterium]|nr:hypothetical protein [Candidatus Saccharimonadales bacterium]